MSVEGLPSGWAGPCPSGPGLGQDRANTCVDAEAGWAVTGADSTSELGYLVPESWVPGADEVGRGENWRRWSSRKPPICPLILDLGGCNGTILINCLKQSRWQGVRLLGDGEDVVTSWPLLLKVTWVRQGRGLPHCSQFPSQHPQCLPNGRH